MKSRMKFVILGSGNVAWQMALRLKKQKQIISQIYSRRLINAKRLANKIRCDYTSSLKRINKEAQVYILAVSDDAIESLAEQIAALEDGKKIFLHTSGSLSATALRKHFTKVGVVWPPQSISKSVKIDFSKVPLCVCAPDEGLKLSKRVAKILSNKVHVISEDQKTALHLACVFANNFSNHMIHIAKDICVSNGMKFKILQPIIEETFTKVQKVGPAEAQTGCNEVGWRHVQHDQPTGTSKALKGTDAPVYSSRRDVDTQTPLECAWQSAELVGLTEATR